MKINEIVKDLKVERTRGDLTIDIMQLTHHSNEVMPGAAFVAIKGYTVDAHRFVPEVIESGAKAIFCNADYEGPFQENITYVFFENTMEALPTLATNFFEKPSEAMTMIGVTGTNGKTSITLMLETMLKAQQKNMAVIGTIENRIGDKVYPTSNTTPDALNLNAFLRDAVDAHTTHCLMEVSSHALKLDRVRHIAYDYAVFTNLTEDHLDFHPDFEDYFLAKAELFKRADKAAIINYDDPYGKRLVDEAIAIAPVMTYGFSEEAMIRATSLTYSASGTNCSFITPVGNFEAFICIPGDIYVLNTMACIGVLIALGSDLDALKSAICQIKPVRGRLERVGNANVIVDYSHTPDSLENVIKVVRKFTSGKVITVFGCGGDRDRKKRPIMGEIAQRLSDVAIATSDNPRTENAQAILDDIFTGINEDLGVVYREADREKAIARAIKMMSKDDVVIIAGKGHETYQIIGREKHHFDDVEIAMKYLQMN